MSDTHDGVGFPDDRAWETSDLNVFHSKVERVRLRDFVGDLSPKDPTETREIAVEFCGAIEMGVGSAQRAAIATFVANEPGLYRAVREMIYDYYKENYYSTKEAFRELMLQTAENPEEVNRFIDDNYPEIVRGDELDGAVTLVRIYVHPAAAAGSKIGIVFHCDWDEENDIGVRIVGDQVEAVGPADTAYLEVLGIVLPENSIRGNVEDK